MTLFRPFGGLFLLLATVSFFWLPALVAHRTILQGDFTLIDLPLAAMQSAALHGHGNLLWSDQIYGGHPLFAEGQGGFAHPLTILWAALVTPLAGTVAAANLIHWLLMLIGGAGMLALCRTLGASRWAACFAMLALVFAPIWALFQTVLPVANSLAWIPWSLWAMERWFARPTLGAAGLLAVAGALVILGGYPQAFHGMVIYMALTLAVTPFQRTERRAWAALGWRRLLTGCMAVVLCSGLAAVQLLPLFELVGHSVRKDGVALLFSAPLSTYLSGLLFSSWSDIGLPFTNIAGLGSLLVAVLASLVLVIGRPSRISGHLVAAVGLFQLGCGSASPLFRLIRAHHLLPGLNSFRVVHLYLDIAAIGTAVAAAFAIDGLVAWGGRDGRLVSDRASYRSTLRVCGAALLLATWTAAMVWLYVPAWPWGQLLIAGIAAAGVPLVLCLPGRAAVIRPFLVVLLLADCVVGLRLRPYQFFDERAFRDRDSLTVIRQVPDWQDYKIFTDSKSIVAGLLPAQWPTLGPSIRHMSSALPAMISTEVGLSSLNGPLALPLARRAAIEPILQAEAEGLSPTPVGRRLIDRLSVRFIALDGPPVAAALRPLAAGGTDRAWIAENTAALPRFRLYAHRRIVPSVDAALAAVQDLDPSTLVLEAPADAGPPEDDAVSPEPPGQLEILSAKATKYRFRVAADRPLWLFLADANYPGWTASVDGQAAPLYTAQILGKAVAVPAGVHEITVRFVSRSFEWGLAISFCALGGLAAIFWRARRRLTPACRRS